jgi:hypothetical protein
MSEGREEREQKVLERFRAEDLQHRRDKFISAALTGFCAMPNSVDLQNDEWRADRAIMVADSVMSLLAARKVGS